MSDAFVFDDGTPADVYSEQLAETLDVIGESDDEKENDE